LPVTVQVNVRTGEIIYTPPQSRDDILRVMPNLENVINDESFYPVDPLIKMAVIHYQFESIHPFYDGNGRTVRIINIFLLILNGLLDIPVLYLSRYIIRSKDEYYRLLQAVRDENAWEAWVFYMLKGVEVTALDTIAIIQSIRSLMARYKTEIRSKLPKIYSQDLLNNLFTHPYTKIEFVERDLQVTRQTASKYLDQLTDAGLVKREKIGRHNFYINQPLFSVFKDTP